MVMHACYPSTQEAEAELLNLWHWEQHASKGYIARPCSKINHLNTTLWYVRMSVAPTAAVHRIRAKNTTFWFLAQGILSPDSMIMKTWVSAGWFGDRETRQVSFVSVPPQRCVDCLRFSFIKTRLLGSCLFHCNSHCPVRVKTRQLLTWVRTGTQTEQVTKMRKEMVVVISTAPKPLQVIWKNS